MRNRLSKIIGRSIKQDELIRDYYPAVSLQQYIAINEAATNLMMKNKRHPLTAVEEAASLVLPFGYIPTPINFVEHIKLVRLRIASSESGQANLDFPQN